jgi:hypothetical protein
LFSITFFTFYYQESMFWQWCGAHSSLNVRCYLANKLFLYEPKSFCRGFLSLCCVPSALKTLDSPCTAIKYSVCYSNKSWEGMIYQILKPSSKQCSSYCVNSSLFLYSNDITLKYLFTRGFSNIPFELNLKSRINPFPFCKSSFFPFHI